MNEVRVYTLLTIISIVAVVSFALGFIGGHDSRKVTVIKAPTQSTPAPLHNPLSMVSDVTLPPGSPAAPPIFVSGKYVRMYCILVARKGMMKHYAQ